MEEKNKEDDVISGGRIVSAEEGPSLCCPAETALQKTDDTEVVPPQESGAGDAEAIPSQRMRAEDRRVANNPLHGVTLQKMLEVLVEKVGWEEMGQVVAVRCFRFEPSVKSSLVFLRRTEWARKEVENLYLRVVKGEAGKED